jgi:integrase
MPIANLDRKTIAALELPAGKSDVFFWDEKVKGYAVRVRRSDASGEIQKTLTFQYRFKGRSRKYLIGEAGVVPADQARKKATELRAKVALGFDPAAERDAERTAIATAMTFGQGVELYLSKKSLELRASSLKGAAIYLRSPLHFGSFHKKPLAGITPSDVSARLDAIFTESGPSSAKQARTAISALFTWCMKRQHCEKNPVVATEDVEAGAPRDRALSDDELRAVWNACDMETNFGRMVRLLILTGCRRQEIGSLQWSEIDLNAGTITLPPERTKNGRKHVITLPEMALAILRAIPQRLGTDSVFGSRGASGYDNWRYGLQGLKSGVSNWKLHDLRRTFRSGLGRLGISPHIAERCVNHHQGGLLEIYDVHKYEIEKANALQRWADHVSNLINGTKSNVVRLQKTA